MVDDIVDGSERRGRIDIRVGVGRRRRWCAEDKGRIVAESYAPGAVASEVARRHEITPQHLFAADSGASRPPFRNDVAHPFRDYAARRSEMISPTNPG